MQERMLHYITLSNPHFAVRLGDYEFGDFANKLDDNSAQLMKLRLQHRELDEKIQSLIASHYPDTLHIQRLKRAKLSIKDKIEEIEASMNPDIIA